MANKLIIFEDAKFADFYPLTLSRPVFSLRCGIYSLWEKIARRFNDYETVFSCRPDVAELLRSATSHEVNQIKYNHGDRLIFINGRLRLGDKLTEQLKTASTNQIFHQDKTVGLVVINN